jgi:ketosteroid isomerase-like protein
MRRYLNRALAVALCATVASCASTPSGAGVGSGSAEEIRAMLDTTAAGWNRGDLATYMRPYHDSVVSNGANGFVTGRAAMEDVMRRGFWRTGRPIQVLHYEDVVVRPLERDHALVTGRFVLTGADRPERRGLFSTVWMRTDAGWRMIHDHSG